MTRYDRYSAFYHVAKAGSFSKAAQGLYMTQPALSHAVKKLEEELGCRLFIRLARGVSLTPEGQALFDHVGQAYAWIERGERMVSAMQTLSRGEIRIGSSETLCRHFLLPQLARFHQEHPLIALHVLNGTSRQTLEWLQQGRIDFGLVNLPLPDRGIQIDPGPSLHDCFVIGDSQKLLVESPLSLDQLSQLPIICLESGSVSRDHLDSFFRAHGLLLTPEIELGDLDLVIEFAKSGLGVGVAAQEFLMPELAQGSLHQLLTEPPMPSRSIGLIRSRHMDASLAAQAFIHQWHWESPEISPRHLAPVGIDS